MRVKGGSRGREWLLRVWTEIQQRAGGQPSEGASLAEYMLLVVLIAIVALIALQFAGAQNSEMWSDIGSSLN
ncbi:MAG: Flp family type IVb pilin [Acidimicrobiia bacterium]